MKILIVDDLKAMRDVNKMILRTIDTDGAASIQPRLEFMELEHNIISGHVYRCNKLQW